MNEIFECPFCGLEMSYFDWKQEIQDKIEEKLVECDECGNNFKIKVTIDVDILVLERENE